MRPFTRKLGDLLKAAVGRQIVDDAASRALLDLAEEQERDRGVLALSSVLGWLGGIVLVLGVILLVSTNWEEIPDTVKICGFLLLFAGSHGAGLYIRLKGLPYEKTAAALNFVGAGLFIAGVGLISQIYNLHERPPNGILMWIVAIVPLAVMLRSVPTTVLSVAAIVTWLHMEGSFDGSPVEMPDWGFTPHLMLEIGIGAGLVGFSGLLKNRWPDCAAAFRCCGIPLLFYGIYMLGFYRHFAGECSDGSLLLPALSLGLGAIGLVAGWRHLGSEWPRHGRLVGFMLGFVLLVGAAALAVDAGYLPGGPKMEDFRFGYWDQYSWAQWTLSALGWLGWFAVALWCVGFGTMAGRRAYVNLGIVAFGLGVITRFFDLIGGMAGTGTIFLLGGAVLMGTAYGMERWRRALLGRMKEKEQS